MIKAPTYEELIKKKRKLFITIYTIIFLFSFYVIVAVNSLYREESKEKQKRLYLLAAQLKAQTGSIFDNYVSYFKILSELQAIKEKKTDELNELFNRLNKRFSEFENVAAVDEKGLFFASGQSYDLNNPPNISKLVFFQKTKRKDNKFVIMEPHIGPISHQEVTGVVVRLEDENHRYRGLLGASIKLSYLKNNWVKFADKNSIKLFCYRGKKNIYFSKGIDEAALDAFFSGSKNNRIVKIGKKEYFYSSVFIPELFSNIVLFSEDEINYLKGFISDTLNLIVMVLFIGAIGILLFFHLKEDNWLKLLMRKEMLLNATQKLTKVGGWEWDMEKQTIFWTDEVYRIHDFQPSEFTPGLTKHIERSVECYDPEDRPVIMEAFRNCAEKGLSYDLEFPFTTAMDRRIWIRTSAEPVLEGDRVVRVVGNIMDITERKKTEDTLRQSEGKLRIRNKINRIFLTHPDDEMYGEVLKLILKATQSPFGTFGYISEDGDRIVPSMTRDIWDECKITDKQIIFPRASWGDVLWARCLKEKKSFSSNGPFKVPDGHIPITRAMTVPIIHQGEAIGNLVVGNKQTDYIQEDKELLESIADNIAPILFSRLKNERYEKKRQLDEEAIKASLKEKEILLGEIHHRVKNNMQVIISLLRLQKMRIQDKKYANMFKESEDRIRSMSLIHEQLYRTKDFANIDFEKYVKGLVNGLIVSHGVDITKVKLNLEIEDVIFDLENAIPCGLIINELFSNSLKHAFPQHEKGNISIVLRSFNKDELGLTVSDDGVGIPEDLDIKQTDSMGLHLVRVLAEHQLKGEIEIHRTQGTACQIRFKKQVYKKRM